MRMLYILLASCVGICINAHVYALLEPVDTVCQEPQYEAVCDGIVYIWTKCDVLRAISTRERDRQSFSRLIVADIIHVANNMLKLMRTEEGVTDEQKQHLQSLTQQLATAYDDAFSESASSSISCTQHILSLLNEMTDPNMKM